ncbi:MAG: hypothetical protein PHQ84_01250 [Candidatus Omnitrophica bacterium]|jgi:branched-subunit amino acid transport protein AzlD|nr:hypothetical protein [Candidatus Omnitrophota bacterium]MDD3274684.1 hypothetical protein [Candidatus Omnitrophota bacterium]MDD5077610.1 hypothetical protein [Candidatus Omnitrophota bacterium]MDD5724683.1 hypothetical protein [Candidatus Omnitrophota bacterium]
MENKHKGKKASPGSRKRAFYDLLIIFLVVAAVAVLSYFFNIFKFLVDFFRKYPDYITFIDEIISVSFILTVCLAVFSFRRWLELKKETAARIKLQEELIRIAEVRAETERIISKELHSEIEYYRQRDIAALPQAKKKKNKGV